MNVIHQNFERQGLVRPHDGRLFAGVCAGVAQRFGMDPWAVRALFAVSLAVLPGSQVIAYPVLWLLMPEERSTSVPAAPHPPSA
ncbi:phage shock protein PspC (stress-responsive transcriptional regulator) [Kineococcus xinjiangensis]|uniref:Phage shock protein PspC (Stress-responsive transcriptional regulator) n=1 Tax=Kineococcus xinjiangensis TaxID=512762 RepID=A0A2S6IG33_9ACTN|nr:PspC domain-containing protein [Kineococcus xinjiangensis]PPK93172.1 phage shock protein PspC (stress-responsive transcriptional regulator) [Kineococcus xinjiangensis]